jgi:hypothetical protein
MRNVFAQPNQHSASGTRLIGFGGLPVQMWIMYIKLWPSGQHDTRRYKYHASGAEKLKRFPKIASRR